MSSNDAGPSRDRSQRHSNGHTQRKKRTSILNLEDVFEKPDAEEVKKTNKAYRNLQATADGMKMNLQNIDAAQLVRSLKAQNQLFDHVKDPAMAALDAKLIQTTTETAAGLARNMRLDANAFDIDEFLIRVRKRLNIEGEEPEPDEDEDELEAESYENTRKRQRMGNNELSAWEKIGWLAAGFSRRVPGVEFMVGPLSVEHKKRIVARREKAKPLAPETRAQVVELTTEKNKQDTVSNVLQVAKLLDKLDPEREGYNIFKLLVNPKSFGQTVENFFGVSFLIKEGRAAINVEEDGEIMIRACEPHDSALDGEETPQANQHIIELDMEVWKMAIDIFDITESAMPHRETVSKEPPRAGHWY